MVVIVDFTLAGVSVDMDAYDMLQYDIPLICMHTACYATI